MGFFGFFFLLIIVILVFGLTVLHSVIRLVINSLMSLFGFSRKGSKGSRKTKEYYHSYTGSDEPNNSPVTRKKIFAKDEGEYVDFEEIKDHED